MSQNKPVIVSITPFLPFVEAWLDDAFTVHRAWQAKNMDAELAAGTQKAADGSTEVADGADQVAAGNAKLADGLTELRKRQRSTIFGVVCARHLGEALDAGQLVAVDA